ncbi:MAG: hypothetical protein IK143_06660 [Bacteroidales bacterium]|nr:hypothetical protein [Bacteroidales bacterium]
MATNSPSPPFFFAVSEGKVKRGVEVLKGWGLDVVVASNVLKEDHTYAGTVEERAVELLAVRV